MEGIDLMLAGGYGGEAMVEEALAKDPGFALARIARARTLQFLGRAQEARDMAALARESAPNATHRERQHVETLATAITGTGEDALAKVREHVAEFPRDAYVLSQANGVYGLIGFSGHKDRNEEQLAILESAAGDYGDDWWFLAALGFAYNELFQSVRARTLAERSVELYPGNGHGAHTVAHVCFELGDPEAGGDFSTTGTPRTTAAPPCSSTSPGTTRPSSSAPVISSARSSSSRRSFAPGRTARPRLSTRSSIRPPSSGGSTSTATAPFPTHGPR
jgi:tetratricopeptide (TPR) repeat protein